MCLKSSYYPCGKCSQCLDEKRVSWSIRTQQQALDSLATYFGMITYDEENVPFTDKGLHTLCWKDVQDFLKRFRKNNPQLKIKYFISGEYGTKTQRPHYHPLIFVTSAPVGLKGLQLLNYVEIAMRKAWGKGFLNLSPIRGNLESCTHYATKYMLSKINAPAGVETKAYIVSNGLGIGFFDRRKHEFTFGSKLQFYFVPYDDPLKYLIPWNKCWEENYYTLNGVSGYWTTNYNSSVTNVSGKWALPLYYRRKDFQYYPPTIRKLIASFNIKKFDKKHGDKLRKYELLGSELGLIVPAYEQLLLDRSKAKKIRYIKFKKHQ